MYRRLSSHTSTRLLITLLAVLEVAPLPADGVISRKEARKVMKEARGEIASSRSLDERSKKLIAETTEAKPSDLLQALDLPPEVSSKAKASSSDQTALPSNPTNGTSSESTAASKLPPYAYPKGTVDQSLISPQEKQTNKEVAPVETTLPKEGQNTPSGTKPPIQAAGPGAPLVPVPPTSTPQGIAQPIEQATPAQQAAAPATAQPAAPPPQAIPPVPISIPLQPAVAPQSVAVKQPTPGGDKFLVNLSNVSIAEYIRFISRISNKNFLFNEEELNFNVTIISEELTSLDEIMAVLMNELRIHGLSLIEQGNNIIIHNNPNVNSPSNIIPRNGDETIPPNAQIVTRVFRLTSFDPIKAKEIIAPLLSQQAIIEPLPETGFLILTDLTSNVEKVAELLVTLDSPSSGLDVAQYRGVNLYVDSLAVLAERIIAPIAEEGKRIDFVPFRETNTLFIISTPPLVEKALTLLRQIDLGVYSGVEGGVGGVGGFGRGGNGGANGGGLYPNGLPPGSYIGPNGILLGPDGQPLYGPDGRPIYANSPEGQRLLAGGTLGGGGGLGGLGLLSTEGLPIGHLLSTDFDIYKLQYRKGDQLQTALQAIASSLLDIESRTSTTTEVATPTGSSSGAQNELIAAISSVQWLEATNMLIFTGTRGANAKLKELITELDIPNEQVLIELLLLDTSIADSLTYGVDFGTRFGGPNSGGAQGFNNVSSPLPIALNQIPTGLINASTLAQATGFSLGVIGQNIIRCGTSFGSIGALVRAVHSLQDSRIVLNQKIVVEDNQPAEIFVGLNVPFKTQSVANDFGTILTNNFEYRDIGATLKVTPFINQNGLITLQLEQELSTLIASDFTLITDSTFQNVAGAGPTTRKSNTKTTIFVPNGFFVILSGNIQDQDDRTRSNLPCLGGVPVLGALFSNKGNTDNKRALMMFIKPSLISTKEEIHSLTKRQQDIYNQKTEERDMWPDEIDEALDWWNITNSDCPD